jgi:hypothetical protein
MSPVEQSAKVAIGFMDAMKSQPLSLALVVMNFALIGFIYIQSAQFTDQRKENVALFVKVQGEVQQLLAKCVIPPNPSR